MGLVLMGEVEVVGLTNAWWGLLLMGQPEATGAGGLDAGVLRMVANGT